MNALANILQSTRLSISRCYRDVRNCLNHRITYTYQNTKFLAPLG